MSFSFAGTDSENAQVTLRDSVSRIILLPAEGRQAIYVENGSAIPNLGKDASIEK